jgi:hypothetical protein
MGNGFANATAALDPGLIFDCSKFNGHSALFILQLDWLELFGLNCHIHQETVVYILNVETFLGKSRMLRLATGV